MATEQIRVSAVVPASRGEIYESWLDGAKHELGGYVLAVLQYEVIERNCDAGARRVLAVTFDRSNTAYDFRASGQYDSSAREQVSADSGFDGIPNLSLLRVE